MEHTKTKGCLDSLTLKLLAMALMLCDHLWATVLPGVMWLTARHASGGRYTTVLFQR